MGGAGGAGGAGGPGGFGAMFHNAIAGQHPAGMGSIKGGAGINPQLAPQQPAFTPQGAPGQLGPQGQPWGAPQPQQGFQAQPDPYTPWTHAQPIPQQPQQPMGRYSTGSPYFGPVGNGQPQPPQVPSFPHMPVSPFGL